MGLKGKLGYHEIADLFNMVETTRKSGILRIICGVHRARLFFEWGELIRAESNRFSSKLGEILVLHGVVTADEVQEALSMQHAQEGERKLGTILADEFEVSEEEVQAALATQFKAIVSDVLQWPGGSFEFDSVLPQGASDKFSLSASDFLLEVGIETGVLSTKVPG